MELDVNLQKSVGNFTLDSKFLLSGERSGIFGESGSGKSTLMHLLAGLGEADSGHIKLDDNILFCSMRKINVSPEKRRIGVVFQHAHLFPHMSVKKNLYYGWKRTDKQLRKITPGTLFKAMSIESLLQRKVANLSGGERQRVALARTLLACPQLILMDEPLSGLDDRIKLQIVPYLNRVFEEFNIPIIFISHSLLEMRLMTNSTLLMSEGKIKKQLSTERLARTSWTGEHQGYKNLLKVGPSIPHRDLYIYRWNNNSLILTENGENGENLFELDARDILLFKRHPEATSARNLLTCEVRDVITYGNRARITLDSAGSTLIAQVVPESVKELNIEVGSKVVAAIKASSFRKLS